MKLEFAATDKKINSTAIISTYTKTLTGARFKEDSNLTRPIFMIGTDSIAYTSYNYVKVTFDNNAVKYYFIDKFEIGTNHCWYIYCTMDVLATYKTDILSKSLYVLRSYSNHNLNVVDTMYPLTADYSHAESSVFGGDVIIKTRGTIYTNSVDPSVYFSTSFAGGYFYIKAVDATTGVGNAVYVMSYGGFCNFMANIFTIDYSEKFPSIADGVALGVANPIQYISEAYWLPFIPPGTTLSSMDIKLGPYPVHTNSGARVTAYQGVEIRVTMKDNDKHPQYQRGKYLLSSPYTTKVLKFYPFGVYSLDMPNLEEVTLASQPFIDIYINVDIYSGEAILKVEGASSHTLLITDSKNYKVPIQITEAGLTILGALGAALNNIGNKSSQSTFIPRTFSEGIAYGLLDDRLGGYTDHFSAGAKNVDKTVGDTIGSILQAAGTELRTNGTTGAILPYSMVPSISAEFGLITDEDLSHNGRPLCEVKELEDLSGYCICKDGDIGIAAASQDQLSMIKNYLTTGFYIEE